MTKTRKPTLTTKGWEDQPLTIECKDMIRKAIENYIIGNGYENDISDPTIATARQILPYLASEDPRWKSVKPIMLNKYGLRAHSQYVKYMIKLLKTYKKDGFKRDDQDDEMSESQNEEDGVQTPTMGNQSKEDDKDDTDDKIDEDQSSDNSDTESEMNEENQKDAKKKEHAKTSKQEEAEETISDHDILREVLKAHQLAHLVTIEGQKAHNTL